MAEGSFQVEVELGPVIDLGDTAHGRRRVIPIVGGRVSGAVNGVILPAGADYQLIRPDGVTELEARYVLEVAGGGLVYVDNRGYRTASAADAERLLRGEPVDPARVYFRTSPRFETSVPELRWLERTMFTGRAERRPDSVVVEFSPVD